MTGQTGKHLRLVFLFKVVERSEPAIPPEDYLIPQRPKRAVHVRTLKDHVTSNILDSQVTNNSKVLGRGRFYFNGRH